MDELQSMFAQGEHNLIHYVPTLGNKPPGWEYPDGDGYASLPMAMLYANRRHLPKPVHAFMAWVEGAMAPYLARDTR